MDFHPSERRLKDSGISNSSDLSLEEWEERAALVPHLKAARARGEIARFKGNLLLIAGKLYTLQDLKARGLNLDAAVKQTQDKKEQVTNKP